MQKSSREWFDYAYNFSESFLPFDFLTGPYFTQDLSRVMRTNHREFISEMEKRLERFHETLPPETDFTEEKERVMKDFLPELIGRIPSARSIIRFGAKVGDIDLGVMSPCKISARNHIEANVYRDKYFISKYPIIDWDALYIFASESGIEISRKIYESRLLSRQTYNLPESEIEYVKETISNAELVFGSEDDLKSMKLMLNKF